MAVSPQRVLYGYSWYLDAVLPAPDWKWVGLVLLDETNQYQAVMPVPLRRKTVAGVWYEWVVHQPFFCQFLGVFSRRDAVDTEPFFALLVRQFRYGSVFCSIQKPDEHSLFDRIQRQTTHVLTLSAGYELLYQRYTPDRKANLRRAEVANWTIEDSTDPEPLLNLFRDNHANGIPGRVAEWAYTIFGRLAEELHRRGLATLQYATRDGTIEAGALFVREGNRIIYLFNAASAAGRRGNARTLLIDEMIQESAGEQVFFDFESPEKVSIRDFYQSFGAVEEPFYSLHWNRLTWAERAVLSVKKRIAGLR